MIASGFRIRNRDRGKGVRFLFSLLQNVRPHQLLFFILYYTEFVNLSILSSEKSVN